MRVLVGVALFVLSIFGVAIGVDMGSGLMMGVSIVIMFGAMYILDISYGGFSYESHTLREMRDTQQKQYILDQMRFNEKNWSKRHTDD